MNSPFCLCTYQEAKWRSDERAEQLALELDAALTARAKQEMEARAAATKAESDLRSAITAAEQLKLELTSARAQVRQRGPGIQPVQGGTGRDDLPDARSRPGCVPAIVCFMQIGDRACFLAVRAG